MQDLGQKTSYIALGEGVTVYSSDGAELGTVEHVLADVDDDIFEGIVFGWGGLSRERRFVDASEVAEIYERGVVLSLDAGAAERLPEPSANPPELGVHPDDTAKGDLQRKLQDAWDRITGNY